MTRMHTKRGAILPPTTPTHWAQAYEIPQAYVVVEFEDAGGQAQSVGIALLEKLATLLVNPPQTQTELEQLVGGIGPIKPKSLLIAVPVGRVLHVHLVGAGALFIKRGKLFSRLVHAEGSISGEVQVGDELFLATAGIVAAFTPEKLSHIIASLSLEDATAELMVQAQKNGAVGAGLLVEVLEFETAHEGELTTVAQAPTSTKRTMPKIVVPQLPSRETVVSFAKSMWNNKKRRVGIVVAVLSILFIASIVLGIQKQQQKGQQMQITTTISEAQRLMEEGVALKDLNAQKGRERLMEAKALLDPIVQTVNIRSPEGKNVTDLHKQIDDNLTLAMQIVRGEPAIFFDVSLLKTGATVTSMELYENTLLAIDKNGRALYSVSLSSKNGKIIGGGDGFEDVSLGDIGGDNVYALATGGIHRIVLPSLAVTKQVIPTDDEWGEIRTLNVFGGNVYLLDIGKNRIWKYVATETGFTERREYLNPDTLPDFSRATTMVIDGSVWVSTNDGLIRKFTQGREDTFIPTGVEPSLGKVLFVYTSDDEQNIYVLDGENKRVVVLTKTGEYLSQYSWEGTLTPTNILVSEADKKILLLANGIIYSLDIR